MAFNAASRQAPMSSAPDSPPLISSLAKRAISILLPVDFLRPISNIFSLLFSSGTPTYIMRSILPGLINAPSNRSGRFVAHTMTTRPSLPEESLFCWIPSSSVKSWDKSRSPPPFELPPRFDAIASTSSKKIMAGLANRALRNKAASALSLSPSHLLSSSGPLTARKFMCPSVAKALAMRVFEQPGGPYKRTPLGGRIPSRWNVAPCVSGSSMASRSCRLTVSMPPIDVHGTDGTSTVTALMADGLVERIAFRMVGSVTVRSPPDNSVFRTASFAASLRSAPVKPLARRASDIHSESEKWVSVPRDSS
mmetsp:Transcript_31550/g.74261  ORF Transcript_31550/g.74261 Transcript_31550/m.74261 type:complete len:308 (-) Transcript_31550:2168-3091(-)